MPQPGQVQMPTTPQFYYAAPRTNGLAVTSLVASILAFSLIGVICGHIALRQIRERGEAGENIAIAGLVLGYLELTGIVILVVVATVSAVLS